MKVRAGKKRRQRHVQSENSRLYRQLVPAYELLFPMIIGKHIHAAIESLGMRPGMRVLDVGVGTGISLPAYPHDVDVIGIDLSSAMLAAAEKKIRQEGWNHLRVQQMNAEHLEFPDDSFDVVTAFHVVSVVSHPRRMMEEMTRVCRPGGRLLIVNHFRSQRRWIAGMVDRADAVTRHLGWRTDLTRDALLQDLPLRVHRCYKPSPMSLFTVLELRRTDEPLPRSGQGGSAAARLQEMPRPASSSTSNYGTAV